MPKHLQETGRLTEAAVAKAKETGRLSVQLVSPGWGSSGYYSAEVLEAAVAEALFPAGTHMYADHPTPTEARERPVRSIKDLMSVTACDGRIATETDVAEWGADLGAVVAEVDVLPAYRDVVEHLSGAIGVSIRGDGELVEGEAEGRRGPIVESLAHIQSVDWVTRAGRGGRVLTLVESARATSRAIARGLSEATADERSEQLSNAVRAKHGTGDGWAWVRDFDDDKHTVWYETGAEDEPSQTWEQTYTVAADDLSVALTGAPMKVRAVTKYVSATRPDGTTEESEEDTMPNKTIEEAEYNRLVEESGRVGQLEEQLGTVTAERDTIKVERDNLKEAEARRTRTERATTIISEAATEAGVSYSPLEVRGLCVDLPLTEAGEFDEEKFKTSITEDAATRKAAGGSGSVIGHGGSGGTQGGTVTEADFWSEIDTINEQKGA